MKVFAVNYSEGDIPIAVAILVKSETEEQAKEVANRELPKMKQYKGRKLLYHSIVEQKPEIDR